MKPVIVIHLVNHSLGYLVLSDLQIGINEVVHCMQLVVHIFGLVRDKRCLDVRRYRFSQIADGREMCDGMNWACAAAGAISA